MSFYWDYGIPSRPAVRSRLRAPLVQCHHDWRVAAVTAIAGDVVTINFKLHANSPGIPRELSLSEDLAHIPNVIIGTGFACRVSGDDFAIVEILEAPSFFDGPFNQPPGTHPGQCLPVLNGVAGTGCYFYRDEMP